MLRGILGSVSNMVMMYAIAMLVVFTLIGIGSAFSAGSVTLTGMHAGTQQEHDQPQGTTRGPGHEANLYTTTVRRGNSHHSSNSTDQLLHTKRYRGIRPGTPGTSGNVPHTEHQAGVAAN